MGAQADGADGDGADGDGADGDGTDGDGTDGDGTALDRLLAERGDQLMRAAVALAGSRVDGEDLLQAALERLIRSRYRVESDLEGYLRRILYNLAADGWRRRATGERRLRLIRSTPGADAEVGPAPNIDLRDALVRFCTTQFNEGGVDQSSILWTRGHVLKVVMFHAKGKLDDESLTTERGLLATYTDVDYNSRSWYRGSENFFVYKWAIPHCALQPLDPAEPRDWVPRTLAKEIKHDIACGQVKVAGRQHIDGVDAIRLAFADGHLKVPWYDKEPAITHQTMWIDAHSYLPLRYLSTLTFAHAKPGSPRSTSTQCDFKWLPATKSALAKLRLTIPRGFHQAHPKTFTVPAPAPHKSAAKHK